MSKTPPVPPENRSPAGPGEPDRRAPRDDGPRADEAQDERNRNLEQQGRQGNTHQNTHHQGYQQDR